MFHVDDERVCKHGYRKPDGGAGRHQQPGRRGLAWEPVLVAGRSDLEPDIILFQRHGIRFFSKP